MTDRPETPYPVTSATLRLNLYTRSDFPGVDCLEDLSLGLDLYNTQVILRADLQSVAELLVLPNVAVRALSFIPTLFPSRCLSLAQ